jgi:N-acetylmuramoyl-L-alanine amidase
MLSLLALALAWSPGAAWAAAVESVRVADGRIVIRFDGPVANAASTIAAASRQILVDVADATPGRGGAASGPVARITQAKSRVGARITFELGQPAVIGDAQFGRGGRELTLELQAASEATFAAASQAGSSNYFPFSFGDRRRPKYKISVAVPPPAKPAPLPQVRGGDRRPLVVIDAGHGGVDPGAISPHTGLREKDATLRIAKAIRDELVASGRVRVALTREDDRYLVLRERYGIARRLKADLFISVHCDSVGVESASGASVYTLSEVASDKEAARLAARENKADVIGGVDLGGAGADVRSILIDLAQRETMNQSAGFARLLGREAKPLIPVKPVFHRMASLMVLKAPDLPSVLFETGYISNPNDAEFLNSKEGRERIAQSVTKAVEVHFARRMAAR